MDSKKIKKLAALAVFAWVSFFVFVFCFVFMIVIPADKIRAKKETKEIEKKEITDHAWELYSNTLESDKWSDGDCEEAAAWSFNAAEAFHKQKKKYFLYGRKNKEVVKE